MPTKPILLDSTGQSILTAAQGITAALEDVAGLQLASKMAKVAPDFSASAAYAAGDYVFHDGTLYCFTADHAAGAWIGTDAAAAVIGTDLTGTIRKTDNLELQTETVVFPRDTRITSGIKYQWDGSKYLVTGTASSHSTYRLVPESKLPPFIVPGKQYYLHYETTDPNVRFSFIYWDSSNTPTDEYYSASQMILIPSTAVKWAMRLFVSSGANLGDGAAVTAEIIAPTDADVAIGRNAVSPAFQNLLYGQGSPSVTSNGVTYIKKGEGKFAITGTLANGSTTIANIYYNKIAFPDGIVAGGTYAFGIKCSSEEMKLRVITFTSSEDSGTGIVSSIMSSGDLTYEIATIPADATGISVRLQRTNGTGSAITFNAAAEVCAYSVGGAYYDFLKRIAGIHSTANENANLIGIGNSFLGGAVWQNHEYSHLAGYEDTIYGQIAMSYNIPKENVSYSMFSSTGLIYNTSLEHGTLLEEIEDTSLSGWDFLLTQISSGDLGNDLGSTESVSGDGSVAGAVIELVEYIKQSNGLCKLILFSVPPYSSDPAKSGDNVFTGLWPGGYSINDLDDVMYQLAKLYHFIYVSWQDLEISYHYMDYADYQEGDTTPRHAASDAVYRAFGEYASSQIRAVSSPIAVGKLVSGT